MAWGEMAHPKACRASAIATATAALLRCRLPAKPRRGPPCASVARGSTQRRLQSQRCASWRSTWATSGAWGPLMATRAPAITAAFSRAMAARLSPSRSQWSMPMGPKPTTGRWGWAVVASSRPPTPTSSTTRGSPSAAKRSKAAAVNSSKGERPWRWPMASQRPRSARRVSGSIQAASSWMRSHQLTRWGER